MPKTERNYGNQINKFTRDITATIHTKGIENQEFFDDITNLKNKSFSQEQFISKYNVLFDGTYAKFKDTTSFLASYRRNINPNYYSQSNSIEVQQFNAKLRRNTIKRKIKKRVIKRDKKRTRHIRKDKYRETIKFYGLARNELGMLKNAWEITEINKRNFFAYQEVHITVHYDLVDDNNRMVYPDCWISFKSGISTELSLVELFDVCYDKLIEWINLVEQSKLYVSILESFTHTYRFGDAKK